MELSWNKYKLMAKFEPVTKERGGYLISSENHHHCFSLAVKNDLILKLSTEGTRSTEYLTCPCTVYRTLVSKASHICVWTVSIDEGVKVNQSTNHTTNKGTIECPLSHTSLRNASLGV
jgi:hypothetical protein